MAAQGPVGGTAGVWEPEFRPDQPDAGHKLHGRHLGDASEPRPETLGRIERALGIEIRPEEEAGSHVLKLWDLLSGADREQVLADMIRRIPARSFSPADDALALAAR